jgi:hypothetical protein
MNSTKLLAHLLAIAQHSSEIRRELERGDAARAMVEAHAGRLLKTAARLYAEAAAIEPDKPTWWAAALNRRAEVEQTIINSAKVEVDYLRVNDGGESPFFEAAGRKNLPPGITSSRVHRIKG